MPEADKAVPTVDLSAVLVADASAARARLYELQAENRRNSVLLIVGFLALVLFLGLGLDVFLLGWTPGGEGGLGLPLATPFALLFGAVHASYSWFAGASQVLVLDAARRAGRSRRSAASAQFENVVEEMAIAAACRSRRLRRPRPGSQRVRRRARPEHAAIAVTRGLLEKLDRDELQGVVAHEMSHVRKLDIRAMTLVTALFGAAALLSDVARRGIYHSGGRGRGSSRRSERRRRHGDPLPGCGCSSPRWRRSSRACSRSRSRARASTSRTRRAPS